MLELILDRLSDQLYRTPTHFLLELIQNADDNSYASGVIPSLHMSLDRKAGQGYFRSDCNEIGFTFSQLDALTQVNKSTKKSTSNGQKGYIGEKGIGFKSLFKVAHVVHVASGFYEFKLDRNKILGMLLPIISPFPSADRVPSHTQFLLELTYNDAFNQIRCDMENIEPQLLIFLRKLNRLRTSILRTSKVYRCRTIEYDNKFHGETALISSGSTDEDWEVQTKYVVHRHIVRRLPFDSRRIDVATSEVVLAFAVKDHVSPIVNTQKAFAFLPIDDFGFPVRLSTLHGSKEMV